MPTTLLRVGKNLRTKREETVKSGGAATSKTSLIHRLNSGSTKGGKGECSLSDEHIYSISSGRGGQGSLGRPSGTLPLGRPALGQHRVEFVHQVGRQEAPAAQGRPPGEAFGDARGWKWRRVAAPGGGRGGDPGQARTRRGRPERGFRNLGRVHAPQRLEGGVHGEPGLLHVHRQLPVGLRHVHRRLPVGLRHVHRRLPVGRLQNSLRLAKLGVANPPVHPLTCVSGLGAGATGPWLAPPLVAFSSAPLWPVSTLEQRSEPNWRHRAET